MTLGATGALSHANSGLGLCETPWVSIKSPGREFVDNLDTLPTGYV